MTEKKTSVFLIAHGPVTENDTGAWLEDLSLYIRSLAQQHPSYSFFALTMRDDAPNFIKDSADKKIASAVRQEINGGKRVVVLPFLLSSGGREHEIRRILSGMEFTLSSPLMPHSEILKWLSEQIDAGHRQLADGAAQKCRSFH